MRLLLISWVLIVTLGGGLPSALASGEVTETLEAIWEQTRSADRGTRHSAIYKLEQLGTASIPLLMEIWARENPEDATILAQSIGRLKPQSQLIRATFIKALGSHVNAAIRRAAAEAFQELQDGKPEIVAALLNGTKDKDPWVVYHSVCSLSRLSAQAEAAGPTLDQKLTRTILKGGQALSSMDLEIAGRVVVALAKINPQAHRETILKACTELIRTHGNNFSAVLSAAVALGEMQVAVKEAVALLTEVVDDPKGFSEARARAVLSVAKLLNNRLHDQQR